MLVDDRCRCTRLRDAVIKRTVCRENMVCWRFLSRPSDAYAGPTPHEELSVLFALAAPRAAVGASGRSRVAGYPDRLIKIVPFARAAAPMWWRDAGAEMAKDLGRPSSSRTSRGRGHHRHAVGRDQRAGWLYAVDGHLANAVNPNLNAKLPYDAHSLLRWRWWRGPSASSSSIPFPIKSIPFDRR
jgi:hypothetical protein